LTALGGEPEGSMRDAAPGEPKSAEKC
jgi:hypothetical protein